MKLGDLVINKYDSDPKPILVVASCYDEDGQWVQVETYPDTWFLASNFDIVSELSLNTTEIDK